MKKGWIGLSFAACLALCPTSAFAASQFSFEKLCIENGNPLSGAQFTLRNQQGNVIATAVSDNNGETTFSNIPDGQYQLIESMPPKNYIPATPMYVSVENGQVFIETTLDNGSNIFVYDALSLPTHTSSTVQSSTAMTTNSTVGTSTLKTNSTIQSSETTHSTSSQTMSQNTTTSGEVISSHQSSTPSQTTSAQKTEHSSANTVNQSVKSTTSQSHASTVENSSTSTLNRSASNNGQMIEKPKENRNSDIIPSAAQHVIDKISNSAAKKNDTSTNSSIPSHSQHGRIVQQQLHVTPYGTQHIMIYEDGYQQKASGKPTLPQTGIKSTSWMTLVGIGCIGASLLLMRKKHYE